MSEPSAGIIRREERLKLEVFRDDEAAAEAAAEILAPQRRFRSSSMAASSWPQAPDGRHGSCSARSPTRS
jgi:hypothetical protein